MKLKLDDKITFKNTWGKIVGVVPPYTPPFKVVDGNLYFTDDFSYLSGYGILSSMKKVHPQKHESYLVVILKNSEDITNNIVWLKNPSDVITGVINSDSDTQDFTVMHHYQKFIDTATKEELKAVVIEMAKLLFTKQQFTKDFLNLIPITEEPELPISSIETSPKNELKQCGTYKDIRSIMPYDCNNYNDGQCNFKDDERDCFYVKPGFKNLFGGFR